MSEDQRGRDAPLVVERSHEPDEERVRRAVELLLAQPKADEGGEAA